MSILREQLARIVWGNHDDPRSAEDALGGEARAVIDAVFTAGEVRYLCDECEHAFRDAGTGGARAHALLPCPGTLRRVLVLDHPDPKGDA